MLSDGGRRPLAVVVIWAAVLFALTGVGVAVLWLLGVNLQTLGPSSHNVGPAFAAIELTAYAPTLAAVLVVLLMPGAGGLRQLLRPVLRWRVGLRWYAAAVIGPILVLLLADVIHVVMGGAAPRQWLSLPTGFAAAFVAGSLLAGATGEEIGWRGLGQARLQRRFGALGAALMVAVLWTFWHEWPLVGPGGATGATPIGFGLFLVRLAALSILLAWLYNSTGGSLLIPMLGHAGYDFANNLVGSPADGAQLGPVTLVIYVLAAALVVLIAGGRSLSLGTRSAMGVDSTAP